MFVFHVFFCVKQTKETNPTENKNKNDDLLLAARMLRFCSLTLSLAIIAISLLCTAPYSTLYTARSARESSTDSDERAELEETIAVVVAASDERLLRNRLDGRVLLCLGVQEVESAYRVVNRTESNENEMGLRREGVIAACYCWSLMLLEWGRAPTTGVIEPCCGCCVCTGTCKGLRPLLRTLLSECGRELFGKVLAVVSS